VNGDICRDRESLDGIETRETSAGLETVLSGGLTDTENLDVDLGGKGGLNKQEPDLAVMAGVAWRL
jgi:hypothetical protein